MPHGVITYMQAYNIMYQKLLSLNVFVGENMTYFEILLELCEFIDIHNSIPSL